MNRSESRALQPADLVELQARYPAAAPGEGPPGTPGALTAVVDGDSVHLSWAPASGRVASAYHLVAGSVPGGADLGAVALGAPAFTATGVARGTYYVRIIAVNAAGSSAPTSDVTVVVGDGLPGAPVGVMAAAGPSGSVRVLWQPPVTGATPHSYTLLVGTSPGHPTTRIPVGSTVLAATGVAAGTYFVRAVGVNDAGAGPASAEIAVVVP
ncbi:MAG: fibronectin type III domain-containing protein [Vicinamibacterales bacterium]